MKSMEKIIFVVKKVGNPYKGVGEAIECITQCFLSFSHLRIRELGGLSTGVYKAEELSYHTHTLFPGYAHGYNQEIEYGSRSSIPPVCGALTSRIFLGGGLGGGGRQVMHH